MPSRPGMKANNIPRTWLENIVDRIGDAGLFVGCGLVGDGKGTGLVLVPKSFYQMESFQSNLWPRFGRRG